MRETQFVNHYLYYTSYYFNDNIYTFMGQGHRFIRCSISLHNGLLMYYLFYGLFPFPRFVINLVLDILLCAELSYLTILFWFSFAACHDFQKASTLPNFMELLEVLSM
jgi:hypothetical protein